jgi:hypothetical protein
MSVRIIFAALVLIIGTASASGQSLPAPSTWKNQRGSILTITTMDGSGNFVGSYDNEAPGYPCHDTFDMKGKASGTAVTFAVVWKNSRGSDCGSVTAWRGRIIGSVISTRWKLAYGNPTTGQVQLKTGRDSFSKQ